MSGPVDGDPFARLLGLRMPRPGEARLAIRPELINDAGVLLGPVGFALVDYAMGSAVWDGLEPGRVAVTVNVAINYVAGSSDGEIVCMARLDRRGGRLAATSAAVHHADGRLLMTAVGTFALTGAQVESP
jgi:acyl-coenzyme A thioesterase PaaI-like protein